MVRGRDLQLAGSFWQKKGRKAFHFHALEKEMATHSSMLAWKIPWTEEPGGLLTWGCKELDTT